MRMREVGEGWRPGVPGVCVRKFKHGVGAVDHAVIAGNDYRHYRQLSAFAQPAQRNYCALESLLLQFHYRISLTTKENVNFLWTKDGSAPIKWPTRITLSSSRSTL